VLFRSRELFAPNEPLGLGLWLPNDVAMDRPAAGLIDDRFRVRTINGFPFGDFHDAIVKHNVYKPTWASRERLDYTLALAEFLSSCISKGETASISTVPLGWRTVMCEQATEQSVAHFRELALAFRALEDRTGRRITLDLEPEPGCVLDMSNDVVRFFNEHLSGDDCRTYIGVCHDVCHAAVMFEDQRSALENYAKNGIRVNKVQVSNAPRAMFDNEPHATLDALRMFHEERYLHQTCARDANNEITFYEDLPLALERAPQSGEEWRTHFHVPVYLDSLGELSTTQADIIACMDACTKLDIDPMWEVETYAWNVLPPEHTTDDLATGIAKELAWTRDRLAERGLLK